MRAKAAVTISTCCCRASGAGVIQTGLTTNSEEPPFAEAAFRFPGGSSLPSRLNCRPSAVAMIWPAVAVSWVLPCLNFSCLDSCASVAGARDKARLISPCLPFDMLGISSVFGIHDVATPLLGLGACGSGHFASQKAVASDLRHEQALADLDCRDLAALGGFVDLVSANAEHLPELWPNRIGLPFDLLGHSGL